jgi:hypothetical protein
VNLAQTKSKVLGRSTSYIDLSQSCPIGVVVPDPVIINKMNQRNREIVTSLGMSRPGTEMKKTTNLLFKMSK